MAARAVFDALAADELEYFDAGRADAWFSEGARADAARAAARRRRRRTTERRTRTRERPSSTAAVTISAGCSPASRRSWPARASTIARRCSGWRPRHAATARCGGRGCRSSCSTCRSIRTPSGNSSRRWSTRSPDVLATVPDGDTFARDALRALGGDGRRDSDFGGRVQIPFPICLSCGATSFTKERPRERERAGDVRLVLRARRRARGGRNRPPCAGRGRRAACRSTRWRSSCARRSSTSACSSTPARAATCRCTSIAAPGGPIPAGRAFVALLSCAVDGLSAKRFDEYLSLGQVPQVDGQPSAGGRAWSMPLDEVFADDERRARTDESDPTSGPIRSARPIRASTPTMKRSWPGRCGRRGSGKS